MKNDTTRFYRLFKSIGSFEDSAKHVNITKAQYGGDDTFGHRFLQRLLHLVRMFASPRIGIHLLHCNSTDSSSYERTPHARTVVGGRHFDSRIAAPAGS